MQFIEDLYENVSTSIGKGNRKTPERTAASEKDWGIPSSPVVVRIYVVVVNSGAERKEVRRKYEGGSGTWEGGGKWEVVGAAQTKI